MVNDININTDIVKNHSVILYVLVESSSIILRDRMINSLFHKHLLVICGLASTLHCLCQIYCALFILIIDFLHIHVEKDTP